MAAMVRYSTKRAAAPTRRASFEPPRHLSSHPGRRRPRRNRDGDRHDLCAAGRAGRGLQRKRTVRGPLLPVRSRHKLPGALSHGLCSLGCDGTPCPSGTTCSDLSRSKTGARPAIPGGCRSVCLRVGATVAAAPTSCAASYRRSRAARRPAEPTPSAGPVLPPSPPTWGPAVRARWHARSFGLRTWQLSCARPARVCSAACATESDCPSSAACAAFASASPPAPTAPRCLARCDASHPAVIRYWLAGRQTAAGSWLHAPRQRVWRHRLCSPSLQRPADCPGGACTCLAPRRSAPASIAPDAPTAELSK